MRNAVLALTIWFTASAGPGLAQQIDPVELIEIPGIANYAPSKRTVPLVDQATAGELLLEARLTEDTDPLPGGVVWRIYNAALLPGEQKLRMIATAEAGSARFLLDPGDYLVHAAFGRAGATTKISIGNEPMTQTLLLDAGGLRLNATLPGSEITRPSELRFDIHSIDETTGEYTLIVPDVPANEIVRLPAGTYHVLSRYGSHNAEIRADLRVEAGKTTTATIQHQAAFVSFELVRAAGGAPLADTAWSILSPTGEIILEHAGPSPSAILSGGTYTIVAENRDTIYQREVSIEPGEDTSIEILAKSEPSQTTQ